MVGIRSKRSGLAAGLVVLALVAGIGLRAGGTAPKTSFTHDEAISYLSASCHQGSYQRVTFAARPPFARWARASEWQRMLQPDRALCFATIAGDLSRFDIHPPLYFWLLHLWSLLLGVGIYSGPALNIALSALGTLALFGLARRALGDEVRAALVAGLWTISPAVVEVFAEARQYELFGLLTVLCAWQTLRFADGTRPLADGALLAVAASAGLLTHYHFALVLAGGGGVLAVRLARSRPRRLVGGLGALAAGGLGLAVLHPGFWMAFATQRRQAGGFVAEQLPGRLDQAGETLSALVLPPGLAETWLKWPVVALLAAALVSAALATRRRAAGPGAGGMVALAAWLGAATVGLYLLFVSHGLAMTPKYLAAVWPFAAFVPVIALGRIPARARAPTAVLAAVLVLVGGVLSARALHAADPALDPTGLARSADRAVVDNVARGIFPRVVWTLEPRTRVYAASQAALLERPDRWTERLTPRSVLVTDLPESDPRYGNSPQRGRRVLAEARRRRALRPGSAGVAGLGRVYAPPQR